MPQMGLHMLVGVIFGKRFCRSSRSQCAGFLVGSIVPDLDFVPLILLRFVDRELALSCHRHLTHSAAFALSCGLLLLLVGRLTRTRTFLLFAVGLTLGMLVHSLLDLLMWFSPVDLLWPFAETVNLYGTWCAPPFLWNTVMAGEPLAYALFMSFALWAFDLRFANVWRVSAALLYGLSIFLYCAIGFIDRELFEVLAYAIAIPFGFLPCVVLIILNFGQLTTPRMVRMVIGKDRRYEQ